MQKYMNAQSAGAARASKVDPDDPFRLREFSCEALMPPPSPPPILLSSPDQTDPLPLRRLTNKITERPGADKFILVQMDIFFSHMTHSLSKILVLDAFNLSAVVREARLMLVSSCRTSPRSTTLQGVVSKRK